jgi:threonylcarbamoyladenosine tRNA methylthiotransferase MtaB
MSPERLAAEWLEVRVTVAAEAAEAVGEELLRLGARGHAWEDLGPDAGALRALVAYFPAGGEAGRSLTARLPADLRAFLAALPGWGLDPGPAKVATRLALQTEWQDQWKAFFRPTRVGRRLVVHPPWELPAATGPEDILIVIDPGQAFGTGNHATTRGALELLEEVLDSHRLGVAAPTGTAPTDPGPSAVSRVFDLGTGSGILAIAAAKLGIAKVLAVDNDPVAVEAAGWNVTANGVTGRVEVALGDLGMVLACRGPAGLILANVTTDLIESALPAVSAALEPGGVFVAAGIATGEATERVAEAARAAGLSEIDRRSAENWTSFAFRKGPRPLRAGSPRAVFYTLGCKANLYDTAGLMDQFRQEGWHVDAGHEEEREGAGPDADLYVVNSCAVTTRAEGKSRQLVRRLKREHPMALVALVGCYPEVHRAKGGRATRDQAAPKDAADPKAPPKDEADLILGTSDRLLLLQRLRERGLGPSPSTPATLVPATLTPVPLTVSNGAGPAHGAFAGERTRATLKVQDGCEQFCTYCVIPYARGPSRSRPAPEVLEEATGLARAGFREIVVTGIHLGVWGVDLGPTRGNPALSGPASIGPGPRGPRLADLIRDIAAIPGLARVRLSSIEPLEVTDDLIELLASNPRVCCHLHIPLQSGSDTVLARMNRHYAAADYLALVARVRSRVPRLGLTTDVMVGFPGETDEEFQATLDTVRQARFSRLHVFRFSRRPGTPAADMPGQVEAKVKKARSEELIGLGHRLAREFHESLVGQTLKVLVERAGPAGLEGQFGCDGGAEGLADNYVRVMIRGPAGEPNDLVPVRVEEATNHGVAGRLVRVTGS